MAVVTLLLPAALLQMVVLEPRSRETRTFTSVFSGKATTPLHSSASSAWWWRSTRWTAARRLWRLRCCNPVDGAHTHLPCLALSHPSATLSLPPFRRALRCELICGCFLLQADPGSHHCVLHSVVIRMVKMRAVCMPVYSSVLMQQLSQFVEG